MPEIELQLNDKSLYPQTGKIETISGIIDQNTGTVSLRAAFPNEEQLLNSGGSGNVIIPVTYDNCVVIPQAATGLNSGDVIVAEGVGLLREGTPIEVKQN